MNTKHKVILFHILLFLFIFIYFLRLYPFLPYNGDDWYFGGALRKPWPMWGVFNPIKVLPEVLEPLTGYISAFLIYPVTGDYIGAFTVSYALVIAIIMTFFCFMYYVFMKRKIALSGKTAAALELLFFLFFFVSFKSWGDQCKYFGFWTSDVNCFFNYPIPGMFNAALVMLLALEDMTLEVVEKWSSTKKGLVLLFIYFSIFSSIQMSIILSGYCLVRIVYDMLIKNRFGKSCNLKEYLKRSWFYITIIGVWFGSLIFEAKGWRAHLVSDSGGFSHQSLLSTISGFTGLISQMNTLFLIISLLSIILSIFFIVRKKDESEKQTDIRVLFGTICLNVICLTYLLLVYTKAGGRYAKRPDAMWAFICLFFFLVSISLAIIIKHIPVIKSLFPLGIVILFVLMINQNFHRNIYPMDYRTCKAIDEYIINQVITADRTGKNEVEVRVPDDHQEENWPHTIYMADWLQNTLYAHHLIEKRLKITIVPDEAVNDMFYTYDRNKMEAFHDLEQSRSLYSIIQRKVFGK